MSLWSLPRCIRLALTVSACVFGLGLSGSALAGSDEYAFVWAGDAHATSYTPSTSYQFNSTGGVNRVQRLATGRYRVELPGVGEPSGEGNVQVTAYGGDANHCKVSSWTTQASPRLTRITVRCFDATGARADTRFSARYVGHGDASSNMAHLWANDSGRFWYTPNTRYQFNSFGGRARIRRTNIGSYQVLIPMPGRLNWDDPHLGNLLVTAYGTDEVSCYVADQRGMLAGNRLNYMGIRFAGHDVTVGENTLYALVRCHDGGRVRDSRFSLSFARLDVPGSHSAFQNVGAYATGLNPFTLISETGNGWFDFNSWFGGSHHRRNEIQHIGAGNYIVVLQGMASARPDTVQVSAHGHSAYTERRCKVGHWWRRSGDTHVRVYCTDASGTRRDARFSVQLVTGRELVH